MSEIAAGLMILSASVLCLAIVGIAEVVDLRHRLSALERKESKRVKADRLQKIRDRRRR